MLLSLRDICLFCLGHCSNQSPFACSSVRPPEVDIISLFAILLVKQARHTVGVDTWLCESWTSMNLVLLGRAQPVILPNLYSLFMNIKAWSPQVTMNCTALPHGLVATRRNVQLGIISIDLYIKSIFGIAIFWRDLI